MGDSNHKENALSCLGEAEVVAGSDGNSLNSPPAQADYFLQCGIIHAILHLADVLDGQRQPFSKMGDMKPRTRKDSKKKST